MQKTSFRWERSLTIWGDKTPRLRNKFKPHDCGGHASKFRRQKLILYCSLQNNSQEQLCCPQTSSLWLLQTTIPDRQAKLYSIKVVHITSSYRKEVVGPLANDISNFLKYTWFWKHQKFIILSLPRAYIAELLQDKELPFSYYGTTDVCHLKSLALQCSRQYQASVDGHIVKLICFECQWSSRQFLQFLQL